MSFQVQPKDRVDIMGDFFKGKKGNCKDHVDVDEVEFDITMNMKCIIYIYIQCVLTYINIFVHYVQYVYI